MSMLTLNGTVANIYEAPKGVNKETGEAYGGQHRIQHRQLLMFIQGRRFTSGAADYKTIYTGRCVVLNQTGEGGVVYGVARKRCDQRNPETREIARARHVV